MNPQLRTTENDNRSLIFVEDVLQSESLPTRLTLAEQENPLVKGFVGSSNEQTTWVWSNQGSLSTNNLSGFLSPGQDPVEYFMITRERNYSFITARGGRERNVVYTSTFY